MNKVEAYLESDINLNDFDYLCEFGIGLVPELQGKDVVIFAPNIIVDKIIARNGKFTTMNGDKPKWQYEGKGLYMLTTPISLIRKTVNGEYKYSLMQSINGTVVFIPIDERQDMTAILDQFSILIPFNTNGTLGDYALPC